MRRQGRLVEEGSLRASVSVMRNLVIALILLFVMLSSGWTGWRIGEAVGYNQGAYDTWNEAYREGASDGIMACEKLQKKVGIQKL